MDRSDISDRKPFKIYRKDDHWIEERHGPHGEETRRHSKPCFFWGKALHLCQATWRLKEKRLASDLVKVFRGSWKISATSAMNSRIPAPLGLESAGPEGVQGAQKWGGSYWQIKGAVRMDVHLMIMFLIWWLCYVPMMMMMMMMEWNNECAVTKKVTMFQHSHVFHVVLMQGQWLRNQLPIRFARRLDEFLQLPYHGR